MKKNEWKDKVKTRKFAGGCAALALAVIIGGTALWQKPSQEVVFPSYTDPVMEVSIEEEEPPLASKPTTKTTKSTKTKKKKIKLKKASKKSYTKKLPTRKKTSNKTQEKNDATVKTQTTVVTATTEKYTKKSKNKVVTQKITTTVTTVTTPNKDSSEQVSSTAAAAQGRYEISAAEAAPMMDSRVISAFEKLGFKVYVDSSVGYAGHFDARTRMITLQAKDDTIYHELGHFLAFIAGNADNSAGFQSVYAAEKDSYTGVNKAYSTQSSSEYFAESTKDYTLAKASLSSSRPETCTAIEQAIAKITDGQISRIQTIYGPFWK